MRFPIYVISKGRAGIGQTVKFLARDGVSFRLVIEPQEEEAYRKAGHGSELLILPFSNLGQGSIPARNWVWEHSVQAGHARHWILDDNLRCMYRRFKNKRSPCPAPEAFDAVEAFTAKYSNIGLSGLNYTMFDMPDTANCPVRVNCHLYSCILVNNSMPIRWRGRYNEDTDLCLQVIAGGLCVVQVSAFAVEKKTTLTMKGGNAELYQGDGRLKMARSLQRQWPHIVQVKRRFGRPQHVIDWTRFRTKLIPKATPEAESRK